MGALRIYTDENVNPAIAAGLRLREVDAWSAGEAGNLSLSDEEQLAYAAHERAVLFTHDADLLVTAKRWAQAELHKRAQAIVRDGCRIDLLSPVVGRGCRTACPLDVLQLLAEVRCVLQHKEQFVVDSEGRRLGVLLEMAEYQRLLEALEELDCIRAFDAAKGAGETPIAWETAMEQLECNRR